MDRTIIRGSKYANDISRYADEYDSEDDMDPEISKHNHVDAGNAAGILIVLLKHTLEREDISTSNRILYTFLIPMWEKMRVHHYGVASMENGPTFLSDDDEEPSRTPKPNFRMHALDGVLLFPRYML